MPKKPLRAAIFFALLALVNVCVCRDTFSAAGAAACGFTAGLWMAVAVEKART